MTPTLKLEKSYTIMFLFIGSPDHKPAEFLPITGETFEEQIELIINDILEPAGFSVEAWTRLPYLCEGDLVQSYYWLDDAVFILKHI